MSDLSGAASPVEHPADLVLEGGGVKGIALAGAVEVLWRAGYRFPRIAGTSAGAMAGAVLAALRRAGEPLEVLKDIARTLDYGRFRDRGPVGRALGPLGFLVDGLAVLVEDGAYEGDYLHDWVAGVLKDLGVETFGDLRVDEPGGDGRIHHQYGLVVTASDVSRRRLVQLPWDYPEYDLDPDAQSVAHAVRASASLPYFFEPVLLTGPRGTSTLVDGGLLSNYPISIFDRLDERPARWPTIGVRLDTLQLGAPPTGGDVRPVSGPVEMGVALVETAIEGCQAEHVLDPCNVARSISVDTSGTGALDFDVSERERRALLGAGRTAAEKFLADWDFDEWRQRCRP